MSRFCSSVPYKLGVVPGHKSGSRQSGLTNSVSFDNYHRIKPTTSRPGPTMLRKRTIAETSKGMSGEQVMERALSEGHVLITEDRDFGSLVCARGARWGG